MLYLFEKTSQIYFRSDSKHARATSWTAKFGQPRVTWHKRNQYGVQSSERVTLFFFFLCELPPKIRLTELKEKKKETRQKDVGNQI